jgi:hypothetical protein
MFEYGTRPDAGETQSARAYLRGFAVLLVLSGILCLSGGLTVLGLSNLGMGIGLGIGALRINKTRRY